MSPWIHSSTRSEGGKVFNPPSSSWSLGLSHPPQYRTFGTGPVPGVGGGGGGDFQSVDRFQHKPSGTEGKGVKKTKNVGWLGGGGGGSNENSWPGRAKVQGWLAGAARLGSSTDLLTWRQWLQSSLFLGSFYHMPPEASTLLGSHRTTMKIPFVKSSLPRGTEASLWITGSSPSLCPPRKREGINPKNTVLSLIQRNH